MRNLSPRVARGTWIHLTAAQRLVLNTWNAIRSRCLNPNASNYRYYGARGITICDRWSSFESFLADVGLRPTPEHSIERKDPNGNYEPSNCRWATKAEQNRNRRPFGSGEESVDVAEPRSRRDVLDLSAHSRAFLASLDDAPTEDDFCALLPRGFE